jgi:AraC-like DNA-binding protein
MKYHMVVESPAKGGSERIGYRIEAGAGVMSSTARVIPLRPGLLLNISGVQPTLETTFRFEIGRAPIQFGFILSGASRCTYHDGCLKNQTHYLESGSNSIIYLPQTSGDLEHDRNSGVFVVSFLTTANFLNEYFQHESRIVPRQFMNMLHEKEEQYFWRGKKSSTKNAILSQIIENRYAGSMQRLFLESRVLELMAFQLQNASATRTKEVSTSSRSNPVTWSGYMRPGKLLVKDFENPPSVAQLARSVLDKRKEAQKRVSAGLWEACFEYFRDFRLDHAREILAYGTVTVSETAYRIGYQSLSHFSRAFRRRFGLIPRIRVPEGRITKSTTTEGPASPARRSPICKNATPAWPQRDRGKPLFFRRRADRSGTRTSGLGNPLEDQELTGAG